MDLYDAIEIVEELLEKGKEYNDYYPMSITPVIIFPFGSKYIDALKICLEAAKDKAGV